MARVIRPISIDDELEKDILDKLDSVSNRSAYIKELVKADINRKKEEFTEDQKEAIKEIVYKILSNYDVNLDKETFKADKELISGIDELMK